MNKDDESEFAGLIPGVKRLQNDRINVYQHRGHKKFVPGSRDQEPDFQSNIPSTAAPASHTHFNPGLQKKLQRKIRQGIIRPEASLDLHGYRQSEALQQLEIFIGDAIHSGMRMIIIIHGQGYRSQNDAVIKPLVHRWLAAQSQVLAWCPAQPQDGAAGASYVYLRAR